MNNESNISRPISHDALRAFLQAIEKVIKIGDESLLWDLCVIGGLFPYDYTDEICTYTYGSQERLQCGADSEYRSYSDDAIDDAKKELEEIAYGDFDEAMSVLESDLDDFPYHYSHRSDIFRPDYFETDDRKIWDKLRQVIAKPADESDQDKLEKTAKAAITKLRTYQQKSYGKMVPVIFATYMKQDSDDTVGVSVKLAWDNRCLRIMTPAPFYAELDDFFINTNPIKRLENFDEKHMPVEIGGYKLHTADIHHLFRYEF